MESRVPEINFQGQALVPDPVPGSTCCLKYKAMKPARGFGPLRYIYVYIYIYIYKRPGRLRLLRLRFLRLRFWHVCDYFYYMVESNVGPDVPTWTSGHRCARPRSMHWWAPHPVVGPRHRLEQLTKGPFFEIQWAFGHSSLTLYTSI